MPRRCARSVSTPLLLICTVMGVLLVACNSVEDVSAPVAATKAPPRTTTSVLTSTPRVEATSSPVPQQDETVTGELPAEQEHFSIGKISQSLITPRDSYDVSRPFQQLVKPHFFAQTANGEPVKAEGSPDLILEQDGKVKVRLKQADGEAYLDLLAVESELIGEHPEDWP